MDRQILIHIGTHKTATTSIQGMMARGERGFARHGIYIPKAGRISRDVGGHYNISWAMRGDARAKDKWGGLDQLCAELKRTRFKRALISSEDFEYFVDRPDLLQRLETRLRAAGWEPRYIMFLRDPQDYAISLYHQLYRHGLTDPFPAFIDRLIADGKVSYEGDWTYYLDYPAFVAKWQAAASGPLDIYSYDEAKAGPGMLKAFLYSLGLPADPAILDAPPVPPRWSRRVRYALLGRKLPEPPADPSRLNVNSLKVTDDMRVEVRRLPTAFALPRERMTPVRPV